MMKKKFILEFDEAPALVFVQKTTMRGTLVYQDGIEVKGVRSIDIRAEVGEPTTHTIEHITGMTSDKG